MGGLVGKRYPGGDEITHDDANSYGNRGKDKWGYRAPVGSFEANGYGLYDMAGNVMEWCQDWYDDNYYSKSPAKNPPGPDTGSALVLRGGYWSGDANHLRVAIRLVSGQDSRGQNSGFRCVSGSNFTSDEGQESTPLEDSKIGTPAEKETEKKNRKTKNKIMR